MFGTLARLGEFSQPFKRAQFGLFGGKTKQYGNNVPFSKHKTRRSWLPNVQRKRLPSDALGANMRVKVTTRVLRTIKKYGGVDNYLTQTPAHKLSHEGMKLRLKVKDAQKANAVAHKKTPEGKQELTEKLAGRTTWALRHGLLCMRVKKIGGLLEDLSLEGARKARRQVATELGLRKQLPSAAETMEHLMRQQRL